MILLVVLSLLLIALLTVLFVPIRYMVNIEHGNELFVQGRAGWLFRFIFSRFSFIEGKLHICVRVFGFLLYDNLKEKSPKEKKKRTKKSVKKKKATKTQKTAPETLTKDSIYKSKDEEESKESETVSVILDVGKEIMLQQDKADEHQDDTTDAAKDDDRLKIEEDEKPSFLKKILLKITKIKDKIITFFQEWINKIKKLFESATSIKQKKDLVFDFIKDELNREGFKLTYSSLRRLLKHILPTKLKSKIIFGTGDPCSTGQALGAMSILYSLYGDKIRIIPDFENSRFEGTHYARGRIRLITLLIIVIKLILDKRFKSLKRNFIILKEAL